MNSTIFRLVDLAIDIIFVLVLIRVVISWLAVTSTVRSDPPFVRWINQVTEPLLAPFRRLVPPQRTGGLDISPVLLFLALYIARQLLIGILRG